MSEPVPALVPHPVSYLDVMRNWWIRYSVNRELVSLYSLELGWWDEEFQEQTGKAVANGVG